MTADNLVTDLGRSYGKGRLDRHLRVYIALRLLSSPEWVTCLWTISVPRSSSNS
jgi:hypothetical protein